MKSTKVLSRLLLITFSLFLSCCDKAHSIPDGFFKDKNWTIWKNEERNISIYVSTAYGAKNGMWVCRTDESTEKYLVDMDSYIGISGINRPWELKLTSVNTGAFEKRYHCKRAKKSKENSLDSFSVLVGEETIALTAYPWDEDSVDINYLGGIGNRELGIFCLMNIHDPDNPDDCFLEGMYQDEKILVKGEKDKRFVMSYKEAEATGTYSRNENVLDFEFETNEIFEDLTHLEFKC